LKHYILGKGQVAKALAPHLTKGEVIMYDKGEWEYGMVSKEIREAFLHICIPYSKDFPKIVCKAINIFRPAYIIIHSSVNPGTTKSIKDGFCQDIKHICYSPIMGRHEDKFSENMTYYEKYVAGCKDTFDVFEKYFDFNLEYWGENTESLEYAKLSSTNYMYWNLIFQELMKRDCDKRGYDFDMVYTMWNLNYNRGMRLKHSNWQRPVYDYQKGHKAGGHCLPNNVYLDDNFISNFLQSWQEYGSINFIPFTGPKPE
jgi:hypothetical protein